MVRRLATVSVQLIPVLLCVAFAAGCGGDSSSGVSIPPPPPPAGPAVFGSVLMPNGQVARLDPTFFERLASVGVDQAQALTGNVSPVGRNVSVQLSLRRGDGVVQLLGTAVTNDQGQYFLTLPFPNTEDTCRFIVSVGDPGNGTLTRAFVYSTSQSIDIDFASEAAVRMIFDQVRLGVDLCSYTPNDISNIVGTIRGLPGGVSGNNAAQINNAAVMTATAAPEVQAALGLLSPTPTLQPTAIAPTPTNTSAPPATNTPVTVPTNTPAVATATRTNTVFVPTNTPPSTATRTNTAIAPTNTPATVPTNTAPPATHTPTTVPTNTPPAATNTATTVPTNTPPATNTSTVAVVTSTPTNTPPGATNTPSVPTATPTTMVAASATPTNTSAPLTSTPTVAIPTATNTPQSATATATATAAVSTPTNTVAVASPTNTPSGGAAVCGNGITEAGEQCDDGGTCVGGANAGMKCPPNVVSVPGGVDCGAGVCTPFGGDGCANNCTTEISVTYKFTGAQCVGGVNAQQECLFNRYCVGGPAPAKPCSVDTDCSSGSNKGKCTSECGLTGLQPAGAPTDASECEGVGACRGGTIPDGSNCPSAANKSVPPPPVLVCDANSAAKTGFVCTTNTNCSPGTCINPCGTNGTCIHKSGAVLTSLGLVGVLGIGPLSGSQQFMVGGPDANGMIPVAVPAASVHFDPVTVPLLACACPHGVPEPQVFGPGNSGAGFIGCGSSGLSPLDVDLSQDHNTTPGDPNNGPGSCVSGVRAGLACSSYILTCPGGTCSATTGLCTTGQNSGLACTDCPGGTCQGFSSGGGVCVGGTNAFHVCHMDSDCGADSYCNSPDDPTCTNEAVPPRNDLGAKACLEQKVTCTSGPKMGQACASDFDCSGGQANIFCGTACNLISLHAGMGPGGSNICNSPVHLQLSGSGGPGSAVIVTSTAIGVITAVGDARPCRRAALCTGFAFNAKTTSCEANSQCTSPATCASAYCAGICTGGDAAHLGKPCIKITPSNDCGAGGVCTAGAAFAQDCSANPASACGSDGICVPVNADKGFDGMPCTADDSVGAMGIAATLPTTTGTASSGVVDEDDSASGANPGQLLAHGLCSGLPASGCTTFRTGHPIDCTAFMTSHTVSGASVASAFDQLDGNQIGDDVVVNVQSAK